MTPILSAALFLTSFSALAYEVLLARFFAIAQWHHLAFMVISLSLFGFAASGTVLSLCDRYRPGWAAELTTPAAVRRWAVLYTCVHLGSYLGLVHLPLDYFKLPIMPVQWGYLLLAYLLPAAPFFVAGTIVSLAYARYPRQSGRIYWLNMSASAIGAASPLLLISILREEQLILACGLLPLGILTFFSTRGKGSADRRSVTATVIGILCLAAAIFILADQSGRLWQQAAGIRMSPYKDLFQSLMLPQTKIVASQSSIRGRLDTVAGPYIRFAPGLSLKYRRNVEGVGALYRDGDGRFVLYPKDGLAFAHESLPWAGFVVAPRPMRPLVIMANGGTAIAAAMAPDVHDPVVLVHQPAIAEALSAHYGLSVSPTAAGTYLASTTQQFDLIIVENWSSPMAGTAALVQNHLYTLEAFQRYLDHLSPNGVLSISRRLRLPPSDSLRLWATAYEALGRLGVAEPRRHLILLRNFDSFTLLVGRSAFKKNKALGEFTQSRNFDWVLAADLDMGAVNQFNVFERPHYHLALKQLDTAYKSGDQARFFDAYPLDIVPQGDARPFPDHVIKWRRLAQLHAMTGKRAYTMWLSGEVVMLGVLLIATMVSLLLMAVPWLLRSGHSARPTLLQGMYFLSVGAGFILVEMAAIYRWTQLVGDPVIGFASVLTYVLIVSALGGRLTPMLSARQVLAGITALALLLAITAAASGPLCQWLTGLAAPGRYAAAAALLTPIAALMGLPLAAGMRAMLANPLQRAYGWAANGAASVLMAVVAAAMALEFGFDVLLVVAACAYALAALCWRRTTM